LRKVTQLLPLMLTLTAPPTALLGEIPAQFRVWSAKVPAAATPGADWQALPDGPPLAIHPTPEEQGRGFLVLEADPPAVLPTRVDRLAAVAAPGEYEALFFGIVALRDLAGLKVRCEPPLLGSRTVPADHIDVRWSRAVRLQVDPKQKQFRWEPFLLVQERAPLVAAERVLAWLTFKIPDNAEPGLYTGAIRIQGQEQSALVPYSLRVLPFRLPEPGVEMGMFLYYPSFSDALLERQLIDLREHGINTVLPTLQVQVIYTEGKSRDLPFGSEDAAATRYHAKRLMDAIRRVYGGWRFRPVVELGEQIIFYWDDRKNWYTFWPHSEFRTEKLLEALSVIEQLGKEEQWPALRVYLVDEAGAHHLLDEAVYFYSQLKKRRPTLETWTTIGGGTALGYDEIGQLAPYVDFFSTNRFTPDLVRRITEQKRGFGLYNGSGKTPAGSRFYFGFFGWKTGASQIAQWVYHFGNSFLSGSGIYESNEGYVLTADERPVPSIAWECVREGVDDYRYLQLLWALIDSAGKSPDTETRRLGTRAQETLAALMKQVDWRFMAIERSKRMPPPSVAVLRGWRERIVECIIPLAARIPVAARSSAPPARSPFTFPWDHANSR